MDVKKTAGQIAYEADVAARPLYHDGTPRRSWESLDSAIRWSWERPNDNGTHDRAPPHNNADARAAFATRKAEIDILIERLKAMSDEHFGYAPDEINWGHVGTLDHYAELLKRIV